MTSRPALSDRPATLRGATARPSAWRSNLNLTRELAVTTFKLKYTGSVLGYAWSLVKPLLIFGMTYLVFAVFLLRGRTSAAENFPVQLLIGIVVWTFIADATGSSVSAIAGNAHILRKAYFPRWILVVASTLSATMTLAVNIALVLLVGIPLGWFHLGLQTLLLPLLFFELYLFVVGIGMLLSALFVFYRDLGHVWEILLQLLFYASAIVFPFGLVPQRFRVLMAFNPIAQIIEDMRRALVTPLIPWSGDVLGWLLVVPCAAVCIIFGLGFLVFHRLSPKFGEAL
ncbi:MAG TPA: ABC transporter permease [Candidatus Dormibacteraeota bacterium]|jgi:ABC-2 type transport system permease protein